MPSTARVARVRDSAFCARVCVCVCVCVCMCECECVYVTADATTARAAWVHDIADSLCVYASRTIYVCVTYDVNESRTHI